MPELPDVEVFRQYAEATALHKTIRSVHVHEPDLLESISRQQLAQRLNALHFADTGRHGKYLFLKTAKRWTLVLHFGMTGYLAYTQSQAKVPSPARMTIDFANGYHLAYVCQRKLGVIDLTDDPEGYIREKGLGPDPLAEGFSPERFVDRLKPRRGFLKSALMNQKILAGIGNVYSDEILFQTGFHPRTAVADLDKADVKDLFRVMQEIIDTSVGARAQPDKLPPNYLTRRRKAGRPCPRCGGQIERTQVAGRTAYYCTRHQKKR